MNLNDRDKDLLNALTTRVRLLTAEQTARLWWSGGTTPLALVRRRLRALCEARLLEEGASYSTILLGAVALAPAARHENH